MLGVGGNLQQGLRRGTQQRALDNAGVLQRQSAEFIRKGKDHVEVFSG